jgi:hypothetical protein
MFDEFIAKGEENMHKVGKTLLLTGWLREKKHDKFYLRERACIESIRGSLF